MPSTITTLLQAWREGDPKAMDQLMPLVYRQLLQLARKRMSAETPDHTLRPTELVHEVYLKLVRSEIPATDRAHFYAICARLMRRILIDHARTQLRHKRGAGAQMVPLESIDVGAPDAAAQVLAIHEALEKLSEFDTRKAQALELVVFGGLEQDMAATALEISPATLRRELKMARAWLYQAIHPGSASGARLPESPA